MNGKMHGRPVSPEVPKSPEGTFSLIMADPPWPTYGEALKHYPQMRVEDMAKIPVADWAAPDSMLMIWTLNWRMKWALDLIDAWGFSYRTVGLVWVKTDKSGTKVLSGRGFYTRQSTEMCLLATRGSPIKTDTPGALTATAEQVIISAPRGRHSEKPDEAYLAAEQMVAGRRLEMFCRMPREGWSSWGNEASL